MLRTRAIPLARSIARPAQQAQRRGYAAGGAGGGSNLPLALGLAGIAGLAGYVYMDRSSRAAASANAHEYADRAKDAAKDAAGQAKGYVNERTSAASANTNEYLGRAKDAVEGAADKAKGFVNERTSAASANLNEAIDRDPSASAGQDIKNKAQAAGAAVSANTNEAIGEAKDAVKGVKDTVTGPFDSEKKAMGESGAGVVAALVKNNWVDFKLEKVEPYNHNTNVYTFSFPDPNASAGGVTASALLVKSSDSQACVDDKGKPVIRPYTPISPQDQKGTMDLMIKVYEGGKMSQHIAHLKPGETLSFKGPIAKYPYKANEFAHGFAIGGGSGITPMYQMITHSLELPEDKTKWTLMFANVTEKDILLRERWDKLAKEHPDRFKVVYSLDKPSYFWRGEKGYITKDMIQKYLPKDNSKDVKFFVCGPPGQYAAVCGPKDGMKQGEIKGALGELQYDNEHVFKF
ncbi:hypothetical protein QFC21_000586 [Naganishia friedmannii]|uniref:Uncharacterized protein n=1 Tax=Naganishia friedmannii TaxID=89922 RepID=A0ACC2WDW3_9TREE|nr:hypothetical protein QFC21_000586 [Naganishia friedmannii]